jgi:hypothetical protein
VAKRASWHSHREERVFAGVAGSSNLPKQITIQENVVIKAGGSEWDIAI